jgi:D-cysteine desulfhydrase
LIASVDLRARRTPCHRADRLGAALGFEPAALWVKRDDLTGLAGGGNKARKLELLIAAALSEGADVVVTGGAGQSNHVRMTAAAAAMHGLEVVAVLAGTEPTRPEGNLVLDRLLGAELAFTGGDFDGDLGAAIDARAEMLRHAGRRPYAIPLGGSSALGAAGYVEAADEIAEQAPPGAVVYVAASTGGTHAGLAAGFGDHGRVCGVDVAGLPALADRVAALADEAAALAGRPPPQGLPMIVAGQIGDGYGAPTEACREAVALAARTEGLVLDPVYSGKAMAGLIADRRQGALAPDQPVVFLHTGGMPALFAGPWPAWLTSG